MYFFTGSENQGSIETAGGDQSGVIGQTSISCCQNPCPNLSQKFGRTDGVEAAGGWRMADVCEFVSRKTH